MRPTPAAWQVRHATTTSALLPFSEHAFTWDVNMQEESMYHNHRFECKVNSLPCRRKLVPRSGLWFRARRQPLWRSILPSFLRTQGSRVRVFWCAAAVCVRGLLPSCLRKPGSRAMVLCAAAVRVEGHLAVMPAHAGIQGEGSMQGGSPCVRGENFDERS